MRKGKLGELLVQAKRVSDDQLKKAVDMQRILGGKLGTVIVKLGFITDEDLTRFLAKQENLPIADLDQIVIPANLVQSLPREVLERHQVMPIRSKDGVLTLAMSDPTDFEAIDEIQFLAGCTIDITMASRAQITRCLQQFYEEGQKPAGKAAEASKAPPKGKAKAVEPGLEKALIPLLLDKGIITLDELRDKARDLEKGT
jgi:type IV pilus assembly protein PilB